MNGKRFWIPPPKSACSWFSSKSHHESLQDFIRPTKMQKIQIWTNNLRQFRHPYNSESWDPRLKPFLAGCVCSWQFTANFYSQPTVCLEKVLLCSDPCTFGSQAFKYVHWRRGPRRSSEGKERLCTYWVWPQVHIKISIFWLYCKHLYKWVFSGVEIGPWNRRSYFGCYLQLVFWPILGLLGSYKRKQPAIPMILSSCWLNHPSQKIWISAKI